MEDETLLWNIKVAYFSCGTFMLFPKAGMSVYIGVYTDHNGSFDARLDGTSLTGHGDTAESSVKELERVVCSCWEDGDSRITGLFEDVKITGSDATRP